MGSERFLVKHMSLLHNDSRNGHTGSRPTHNSRIERFWRECSTMVKDYFLEQFRNLEFFGILKTTEIFDIWLLYLVHMKEMNKKEKY